MCHQIENPRGHRETVAKVPPVTNRQLEIAVICVSTMVYGKQQDVLPYVNIADHISEHHLLHAKIISEVETGECRDETTQRGPFRDDFGSMGAKQKVLRHPFHGCHKIQNAYNQYVYDYFRFHNFNKLFHSKDTTTKSVCQVKNC